MDALRSGAAEVALFVDGDVRFIRGWEIRWLSLLSAPLQGIAAILLGSLRVLIRPWFEFFQWFRRPPELGDPLQIGREHLALNWYQDMARKVKRRPFGVEVNEGRGFELGFPFWWGGAFRLLALLGWKRYSLFCGLMASLALIVSARSGWDLVLLIAPIWWSFWLMGQKGNQLGWFPILFGLHPSASIWICVAVGIVLHMTPFIFGGGLLFLSQIPVSPEISVAMFAATGVAIYLIWHRQMMTGTTLFGDIREQSTSLWQEGIKDLPFRMPHDRRRMIYISVAMAAVLVGNPGLALTWLWGSALLLLESRGARLCDNNEYRGLFLAAVLASVWNGAPFDRACAILAAFLVTEPRWSLLPHGLWDLERRIRDRLDGQGTALRVMSESWIAPDASPAIRRYPYNSQLSAYIPLACVWHRLGHIPVTDGGFLELSNSAATHHRQFHSHATDEVLRKVIDYFCPDIVVAFSKEFEQRLVALGGISLGSVDTDLHEIFTKDSRTGSSGMPGPPILIRWPVRPAIIVPDVPISIGDNRIEFSAISAGEYRLRLNASVAWTAYQGKRELATYCKGGDLVVEAHSPGPVRIEHRFFRFFTRAPLRDLDEQEQ